MSKIIITYKTALYASMEANKLPEIHPERIRLINLVNLYNLNKSKSLFNGKPEMDYVVLNENNLKRNASEADES